MSHESLPAPVAKHCQNDPESGGVICASEDGGKAGMTCDQSPYDGSVRFCSTGGENRGADQRCTDHGNGDVTCESDSDPVQVCSKFDTKILDPRGYKLAGALNMAFEYVQFGLAVCGLLDIKGQDQYNLSLVSDLRDALPAVVSSYEAFKDSECAK